MARRNDKEIPVHPPIYHFLYHTHYHGLWAPITCMESFPFWRRAGQQRQQSHHYFLKKHELAEGPVAQSAVAIWQQPVCTEDKSLLLAAWKVWFGFLKMQFTWTMCRELALGINIAAPTFTSRHLEREATSSLPPWQLLTRRGTSTLKKHQKTWQL